MYGTKLKFSSAANKEDFYLRGGKDWMQYWICILEMVTGFDEFSQPQTR